MGSPGWRSICAIAVPSAGSPVAVVVRGVCTPMWISGPWSPPPPTANALGWFALIGWIVPFWAALADRHYAPEEPR
jgi:hypothetical protein